ncbi:ubiquitin family protein [Caldinitratiruptor microaerophilus]|uniref:MoaD/ThiS family protein n=1 Tax=Caldinitratiruptor microaerophilus TaxID=671077 RepID=A0AA35CMT0_9FIRM|nr:hypothetical protein [Caldinitratiruptor microaerophilus]BDG60175.1 hypothetical protein caldi_12650 [Caldinitratiruptor microaerophilus]
MIVHVRVEGAVEWYHRVPQFQLVVVDGASVGSVLELLGLKLTGRERIARNGLPASLTDPLEDGDRLLITAEEAG